jgi:cation transport regulator
MPNSKLKARKRPTKSSVKKSSSRKPDKRLSARTKKQIDSLPEHAQHIYKKTHDSAIEQYQDPEKRRGGKKQSAEEVAHKAAWAAVKRDYTKKGNKWIKKE